MTEINDTRPKIYIPGLPSLSSDDLSIYQTNHNSRMDLVTQLSASNMHVPHIDDTRSWLRDMLAHAEESDAFIFPPMTTLPKDHPKFKTEAAQRWFELLSVVTGVHIGSREKYRPDGYSKPCVIMDPNHQWSYALDILHDLKEKGMFTSQLEDIVQVAPPANKLENYHQMNHNAIVTLQHELAEGKRKSQKDVPALFDENYEFESYRNEMKRHHFGVALFGSATTTQPEYIEPVKRLMKKCGERGWRMITGAGVQGCMGAADEGFNEGKIIFNQTHPIAAYKPSHVGVSTQPILRLEGPPKHLDQLIITDNIYDRMEVMIRGNKVSDANLRLRDTAKVLFVAPGGTGTLHEFSTLMQLATNGSMMKGRKVVLLNFPSHLNAQEGFWDKLIETAKALGFENLFEVAKTPEEAIQIADREYLQWQVRHPEFKDLPHPIFNPAPQTSAWTKGLEKLKNPTPTPPSP